MFRDFFSQVSGESLTQAQQAVMDELLTKLHNEERQA